jgi:acetyl/propionyl-CoA carboxylase alpha subunit
VDTAYLEDLVAAAWQASKPAGSAPATSLEALAAAALALLPEQPLPPLWSRWSSTPTIDRDAVVTRGDATRRWRLRGRRDDFTAELDGTRHRIRGLATDARGTVSADIDEAALRAVVARDGERSWWLADGGEEIALVDARLHARPRAAAARPGLLLAPLHGRVTQVPVDLGATVDAGALLVVIEAMKMEHQIRAPHAGTVTALHARAGEQVAARQPLVEVAA